MTDTIIRQPTSKDFQLLFGWANPMDLTAPEPEPDVVLIDITELEEPGLRLGEFGEYLNDYRDSSTHICDAISEIADRHADLSSRECLDFVSERPEMLADAISEGIYCFERGSDYNFYDHARCAKYLYIQEDLYCVLDDAMTRTVIDFLKYDMRIDKIPEDLYDIIVEYLDGVDTQDRMSDICDKIRDYYVGKEGEYACS